MGPAFSQCLGPLSLYKSLTSGLSLLFPFLLPTASPIFRNTSHILRAEENKSVIPLDTRKKKIMIYQTLIQQEQKAFGLLNQSRINVSSFQQSLIEKQHISFEDITPNSFNLLSCFESLDRIESHA